MFRELYYGFFFYISAAVGGFLGLTFLTPPTSHGPEESIQQEATAIIIGVIAGSGAWLWFKYTRLSPPPKAS